ncbi:MAG TPA: hypothetical protein PLI18_01455 [Pirellulaceae bacterium]|nr:hypothetical protein [Pirellulaceae bacterium]
MRRASIAALWAASASSPLLLLLPLTAAELAGSEPLSASAPQDADASATRKFDLRYRMQPGQTIRWTTSHLASTLTRIEGKESHDRSTTETVKVWTVKRVEENGSIVFEQSIDRINLSQSIGDGEEIRFDSRSAETPPLRYEGIAKTIGIPLTLVTIGTDGRILQKEAIYRGSQMGMDDVAVPLPAEPAAIGATWHTSTDITATEENGRNVVIKLRKAYRLESVADGIATISMRTEVLTPIENPRIQSQLLEEMTAGTIRFDIERGIPISKEMKWDQEVVGFSSPQSFMEFHGRFTETLETESPATTPSTTAGPTGTASTDGAADAPAIRLRDRNGRPILRK